MEGFLLHKEKNQLAMKRLFLLCSLIVCGQSALKAQVLDTGAIEQILMERADSALIFSGKSGWSVASDVFMLSKRGDTVTCYRYRPLKVNRNSLKEVPQPIANALLDKHGVDFQVYEMPQDSARLFWKAVGELDPWQWRDDVAEGNGCPIVDSTKRPTYIYDGFTYQVKLIAGNTIKALSFYEPAFFEKQCPGREGRQRMISFIALMQEVFRTEKGTN